MRLLKLSLRNLGVFQGKFDFDLAPVRQSEGTQLIVVSGHNGAGKSTLFQAINLVLYGSQSLGNRTGQQVYNDFLLNRFHRYAENGETVVERESEIVLSFEYIQSGVPLTIEVRRNWQKRGQNVEEELQILQNGDPLRIPKEDLQVWLNDFFPIGIAALCFFDAEQLDTFVQSDGHNVEFTNTLHRLLGLDLVEQLSRDLDYHIMQQDGGNKVPELRAMVLDYQAQLDSFTQQQNETQMQEEALKFEQTRFESQLKLLESDLATQGGTYAQRRPQLQARLTAIEMEIEAVSAELNNLSSGLLPFALAPHLCKELNVRLTSESDLRQQLSIQQEWQNRLKTLESVLQTDSVWNGVAVSPEDRGVVGSRLAQALYTAYPATLTEKSIIHHLSQQERQQIQEWIIQALHIVPQQAQVLGKNLRDLRKEYNQAEEDLKRAPEEKVLLPIHEEILRLENAIREIKAKCASLDNQIGVLQYRRDDVLRKKEKAMQQLCAVQDRRYQIELAERSKAVLKTYQDALVQQRLESLESALVSSFNRICQKEHLLQTVHIDRGSFEIQLYNTEGHLVNLSDFSAGERQLYVLALLWALRHVSGWQLPLVVDTPLARLDESHRLRFMRDYVSSVSNQVILFTTDAELDSGLLRSADPLLWRVYRLEFNPQRQHSNCVQESPGEIEREMGSM